MLGSKKCYIALLLFSTIFLGLFARSSDVSAVSDYTVSYTNSSFSSNQLVPLCDYTSVPVSCSGYHYLFVSFSSSPGSSPNPSSSSFLNVFRSSSSTNNNLNLGRCSLVNGLVYKTSCIFYLENSGNYSISSLSFYFEFSSLSGLIIDFKLSEAISSPPSGSLSITENGTFNVSSYEYVDVAVPAPPVTTPYDGKLDAIIQALYTLGAVMLVIYFFFALFRFYNGGKT